MVRIVAPTSLYEVCPRCSRPNPSSNQMNLQERNNKCNLSNATSNKEKNLIYLTMHQIDQVRYERPLTINTLLKETGQVLFINEIKITYKLCSL